MWKKRLGRCQEVGKLRWSNSLIQKPSHRASPAQNSDQAARGSPLLPHPLLTEILSHLSISYPSSPRKALPRQAPSASSALVTPAQYKFLVAFSHTRHLWLDTIKPMEVPQLAHSHPKALAVRAAPQGIPSGSPGKPQFHPAAALPGAGSAGSERSLIKTKEARKGVFLLGNNTS